MICIRPISKHTAKHGQFGSTNPSLPSYLKLEVVASHTTATVHIVGSITHTWLQHTL